MTKKFTNSRSASRPSNRSAKSAAPARGGRPSYSSKGRDDARSGRTSERSSSRTSERSYDKPARSYDKPARSSERSYDKPARSYSKSTTGFDKPARSYDKPARTSERSYDKPARSYSKSTSSYDKPARSYDKPARSSERSFGKFSAKPAYASRPRDEMRDDNRFETQFEARHDSPSDSQSESPRSNKRDGKRESKTSNLLYGAHAVRQAWLNPQRTIRRLMLTESGMESFAATLEEAKRRKISRPQPDLIDRDYADQQLPGAVHQGIILDASPLDYTVLEDVLRAAETRSTAVVVALDQVTDPHNVGAIMRTAAAFGALAVLVPERNAPPLTGVLAKIASGAVDVIPLVRVNNLSRALDDLKKAAFWTIGFAEEGKETLAEADVTGKVVLVLGAEGDGLRRLTTERCDMLVRLPTQDPIGSLNVSNAAAIALYDVTQRQTGK